MLKVNLGLLKCICMRTHDGAITETGNALADSATFYAIAKLLFQSNQSSLPHGGIKQSFTWNNMDPDHLVSRFNPKITALIRMLPP